MSFYKNYPNRKDHRKQYRDSRRFDPSCCNHKGCGYCRQGRTHFDRKNRTIADLELKDYKTFAEE